MLTRTRYGMFDAQQALGFLTQQASLIEATVYATMYPAPQYQELVPVDGTGPEWLKSITFFSSDKVGVAEWFHHTGTDVPLADIEMSKFEQGIEMAAVGYRYTLEEIGLAMQVPGTNLQPDRAAAAVRAYEEFTNQVALYGATVKGWEGLINSSAVDRVTITNDGTGTSTHWHDKTPDQIMRDVNVLLADVYDDTLEAEYADTILLPVAEHTRLATTRLSAYTEVTILDWLTRANAYTAQFGRPITIRAVRGLETAGLGGIQRMVIYRRDPDVVKMHIPMPHRFLPPMQRGPLVFDVPGIFRLGGVEWRRPKAAKYGDGL